MELLRARTSICSALPPEISIIRKGFPIWIAQAEDHGSDDSDGFQISLSLIEPGQSLCDRVNLVVVTPMWERKELGN
jgi:hypothetical protein